MVVWSKEAAIWYSGFIWTWTFRSFCGCNFAVTLQGFNSWSQNHFYFWRFPYKSWWPHECPHLKNHTPNETLCFNQESGITLKFIDFTILQPAANFYLSRLLLQKHHAHSNPARHWYRDSFLGLSSLRGQNSTKGRRESWIWVGLWRRIKTGDWMFDWRSLDYFGREAIWVVVMGSRLAWVAWVSFVFWGIVL